MEKKIIETGVNVDIRRTDGRVHSAVVSSVNWQTRSVTVEWFEQGEAKGKELPVDQVLSLNPDLVSHPLHTNNSSSNQNCRLRSVRGNHVSKIVTPGLSNKTLNMIVLKESTTTTTAGPVEKESSCSSRGSSLEFPTARTKHMAKIRNISRSTLPQNNAGSMRQPRPTPSRPTNIIPNGHSDYNLRGVENVPPAQAQPRTPAVQQRNGAFAVPQGVIRTNLAQANQQQQQEQARSASLGGGQLLQHQIRSATHASTQPAEPVNNVSAAAAAAAAASRRSNVVKEVEKLKKNREERRLRQAELKEEKEALMNVDPGNPNWEFLAMIREYRASLDFRPLRDTDLVEDHQITVCVRKRPLNKKENNRKELDVITVPSRDQIVVHEPKSKVDLTKYLENQNFRFDYAFDESCNNDTVYKFTAKPLVQTIFEGGMATCFAYGQTGSGKTHTMGGDFNGKTQDCKKGIYAMVANDVFNYLNSPTYKALQLEVTASFFEIYSGKVFDLLADKAKLRVMEDGKQVVQIVGLIEKKVKNVEEVLKLIQHGNSARTSGQTSANSNSSRSHAVFQITVRTSANKIHGKFSLIDLAGNERGADTSSANRQTRMEGAEINKSLLALKECIRALGRKGSHLPFRASKLTQVLRDSFIGEKSKTCMIAMISPGMNSCEHSLNTLRYADRVKELAASDPAESKISPTDEIHNRIDDGNRLNDSDLAQLRSLNEGELSADLYNFHEAVSQLQQEEEELLDFHKEVSELMPIWHDRDKELYNRTTQVDYDQDAYSANLEVITSEKMEVLSRLLVKIRSFRALLITEEQISQKVKPRIGRNN